MQTEPMPKTKKELDSLVEREGREIVTFAIMRLVKYFWPEPGTFRDADDMMAQSRKDFEQHPNLGRVTQEIVRILSKDKHRARAAERRASRRSHGNV